MTVGVRSVRELVSGSAEETRAVAARLASAARPGDVIALFGALGAGKTEFAKGFAEGLGVGGVVASPSFVLMAEHRGRLPLFHLDLYRLRGPDEVLSAGLMDTRRTAGVTLVEWAERMGGLLPPDRLSIAIEGSGEEPRRLRLTAARSHERYLALLAAPAPR